MGGPHIRNRSRVETELPEEIRRNLDRILLEGATYDEAAEYLKSGGYDISRASVGRYGKRFFEAYQQVRQFEDQAHALKSEVGDGLSMEEAAGKLLVQKVMAAVIDGTFDVLEMPRLISDFAKLQSSSVARERLKADIQDRVKKAAGRVEKIATGSGISPDTLRRIKEEIYGIV